MTVFAKIVTYYRCLKRNVERGVGTGEWLNASRSALAWPCMSPTHQDHLHDIFYRDKLFYYYCLHVDMKTISHTF